MKVRDELVVNLPVGFEKQFSSSLTAGLGTNKSFLVVIVISSININHKDQ